MTAEIAILNKEGVALAADSAVTFSSRTGPKIYNTVNKLFALSKYEPIGIMVFGEAEFMRVPWELIIKLYRSGLESRSFSTVEEYGRDFLDFLAAQEATLFPTPAQEAYLHSLFAGTFSDLKVSVDNEVRRVLGKQNRVSEDDVRSILETEARSLADRILSQPEATCMSSEQAREVVSKHKGVFNRAKKEILGTHKFSRRAAIALNQIAVGLLSRDLFFEQYSGVVIAGFGRSEMFPALRSYRIQGFAGGFLHYSRDNKDVQIDQVRSAAIVPFAQGEMVIRFMEGIDPSYHEALRGFLQGVFDKLPNLVMASPEVTVDKKKQRTFENRLKKSSGRLVSEFFNALRKFGVESFSGPIIEVVNVLPKEELASMAESLVSLTSFKRKVSLEAETVGGPIDVAIISKGDGFIWIKRKHYFKPELNPQFFANYYRK